MVKSSYLLFLIAFQIIVCGQIMAQIEDEPHLTHDEWRLQKEKEGITVYTRWLPAEEGRKARQLHASMLVRASLSAAVMALTYDKQVKKWLNRVKEYKHFASPDPLQWHAYTEFNIPWPLNNQDLITQNVLTQAENTKNVRVEITAIPDYIPRNKGVDRLVHFDGSWNFIPLSEDLIRIDYYIFTKTKPILPRWITDPIIEQGLWSTFDELRKIINENHAKSVSLSYIDN